MHMVYVFTHGQGILLMLDKIIRPKKKVRRNNKTNLFKDLKSLLEGNMRL